MNYLKSRNGIIKNLNTGNKVRIPANLYIWATMNSSDQGVLPLDAAFKRRWSFKYMALNENENIIDSWKIYFKFHENPISWNKLRKKINERLKEYVSEDKLLGPFFLKENELPSSSASQDEHDIFINKLLLYLKEDVLRHSTSDEIFIDNLLSDVVQKYQDGKENIFKFVLDDLEFEVVD